MKPEYMQIVTAINRMKAWQPAADRIRYGLCHCRKRRLMLSFVLDDEHTRGTDETCGYWCSGCSFSNAGSRPIDPEQDDFENWNDDGAAR